MNEEEENFEDSRDENDEGAELLAGMPLEDAVSIALLSGLRR